MHSLEIVYNYFRNYDPTLGRYTESDPLGSEGDLATYSYVKADPLRNIDPLGSQVHPMPPPPVAGPFGPMPGGLSQGQWGPDGPVPGPQTPAQQAAGQLQQAINQFLQQAHETACDAECDTDYDAAQFDCE